jgi:hypothetical protein
MTHKKQFNTLNHQKNKWNEVILDDWGIPVIWETVSTNKVKWSQISKTTAYSGRMIVVWIIILGWILYFISSGNLFAKNRTNWNNTNTAATSSYSCPMMRNWWGGWCGGGSRTTTTTPITTNTVNTTATYETVNVWHSEVSLIPETVTLTAGKSYKLIITPTADGAWCMNTMTFPWLDSNVYPVKKDVPVIIVINNAKAGTYQVVCWAMGMHQWTIIVQ